MKEYKKIMTLLISVYTLSNISSASEAADDFERFCTEDSRFLDHLVSWDATTNKNPLLHLRNRPYSFTIIAINEIKRVDASITIKNGELAHIEETYFNIEAGHEAIPSIIVNVNSKCDFANAYLSLGRELVIAKMFAERIRDKKIVATTSYQDFVEIYRTAHKITISTIDERFDASYSIWIESEGIAKDAKSWLKTQLAEISEKGTNVPPTVKCRIDLLYTSYKSWATGEIQANPLENHIDIPK